MSSYFQYTDIAQYKSIADRSYFHTSSNQKKKKNQIMVKIKQLRLS